MSLKNSANLSAFILIKSLINVAVGSFTYVNYELQIGINGAGALDWNKLVGY
jgi:hypothetical protein